MKRFLKKVLLYIVLFVIIASIADVIITYNLNQSDARMLRSWNDIYHSELKSDMVVMGSSRAWVQYSPKILDSVLGINSYNLGVDGRSVDAQLYKYNAFCREQGKPQFVILNLDIWALDLSNGYEREQFTPYFFDRKLLRDIRKNEEFTLCDAYIPCWRYAGSFQLIKEGFNLPNKMQYFDLYKGYCGRNEIFNESNLLSADTIHFTYVPEAEVILHDFLIDCKNNDIQVIPVFAPIYHIMVEKMFNDINIAYDTYHSIIDEFDLPLLDYTFSELSYDSSYFYNATHLNKKGAELFTIRLAHDIDSLGIVR